jgi:Domain of unknown function (DUF4401)
VIATANELVEALLSRGMLTESAGDTDPSPTSDRPWYIGLLLGTAGWFAGIFALLFIFMALSLIHVQSPDVGLGLVIGFVLLASAWGLFRIDHEGAFVSQLALALSIAGQFLMVLVIHEAFLKGNESVSTIAIVALIVQVPLVFVMPNRLHRTMSTLFACAAWALAVRFILWDGPGSGSYGAAPSPIALAGFVIVWLPIGALLRGLIRSEPAWMAAGRQDLVRPVATGLIVGLASGTLLSYPLQSFTWLSHAPPENWLALLPLLSALCAFGALVAAFALGNRGLMGLCVVAVLLHVSHFYYTLGTSLMLKALTMLALGTVLLGAARYLKRAAPR